MSNKMTYEFIAVWTITTLISTGTTLQDYGINFATLFFASMIVLGKLLISIIED